MKNRTLIITAAILALITWVVNLLLNDQLVITAWSIRKEILSSTGLISFTLMGLIMVLSIRPSFLEQRLGGLDKIYHLHKWTGILCVLFGAIHYIAFLSSKLILPYFGPRPSGSGATTFLSQFISIAISWAEYATWLLLALLVITLSRKISYTIWRYTHKSMAIIFLIIAFHSIVLAPQSYWKEPAGILIALVSIIGSACALISLTGQIGKQKTQHAHIIDIKRYPEQHFELTCKLDKAWHHQAGQFTFLTFKQFDSGHPFTIASAYQNDNQISFAIKVLGDHTQYLYEQIKIGDSVKIEGPYGCFNCTKFQQQHQIWIGAGIGIAPFIAWLDSLQNRPVNFKVDLYYCIDNEHKAVFSDKLKELANNIKNLSLHIYYYQEQGELNAHVLPIQKINQAIVTDICFCGPETFASTLKQQLKKIHFPLTQQFHQEYFQMR